MSVSQFQTNYLLKEPIPKLLPKFAIPCVISLIISCLYNIVDQIFVGNGIGYLGNAATGIIFPITVVGWGASLLFGDGAAAYVSLALGKGDTTQTGKAVANSIMFSFLSGLLIIMVAYIGSDGILISLGATEATLTLTRDYGYIIFLMLPFALVQNTLAAIIRADGNPKYAMTTMAIGAILNIVLDPIAIFLLEDRKSVV